MKTKQSKHDYSLWRPGQVGNLNILKILLTNLANPQCIQVTVRVLLFHLHSQYLSLPVLNNSLNSLTLTPSTDIISINPPISLRLARSGEATSPSIAGSMTGSPLTSLVITSGSVSVAE